MADSVEISPEQLAALREHHARAEADGEWADYWAERFAKRDEIRGDMRAFVQRLLDGEIDLAAFRAEHDRKTRTDWDFYGLKGLSGAMFLNQIVKHVPDEFDAESVVRRALAFPQDVQTGRAAMVAFQRFITSLHDAEVVTPGQLSAARIPFFVSAWWHILDTGGVWPPFYTSARRLLASVGAYEKSADPIDSYFRFRSAFLSAAEALGLTIPQMEALCAWEEPAKPQPPATQDAAGYGLSEATTDLFMDPQDIERALGLLKHKKNIVLQGPPGVGKTFVAKRLAYLLLGEADPQRVRVVQFHQSYSYEDFVQGYRPTPNGAFERGDGPFLRLAERARQDPESSYVMIIDEINRGNLSKIFGELMMLIEADKRSETWATSLAYSTPSDAGFFVPPNLYLIGTMNTADRSLALVDYALRRRFAFFDVTPGFRTAAFSAHLHALGVDAARRQHVSTALTALNEKIAADPALGPGFEIGHSYFCAVPDGREPDEAWFANIIQYEVAPLLREYWFDAPASVASALELLGEDAE